MSFQSNSFRNENDMEIPYSQNKGKRNASVFGVNQFMIPKQKPWIINKEGREEETKSSNFTLKMEELPKCSMMVEESPNNPMVKLSKFPIRPSN